MPWAVSHIAAVLPLRRATPRLLNFGALVIGAMTPDLGLYIGASDFAAFNHTLPGSIVAGLPSGIGLLLLAYLFCRPVVYCLPSPHREILQPCCPPFRSLGWKKWLTILPSLLLGIWTHNFWDAFTHDTGWFVQRIHCLQTPIITIQGTVFALPVFLQFASTIVGAIIVALAYFFWMQRERRRISRHGESDRWRYRFWIRVALASVLIGLPIAVYNASEKHGVLFYRALIFQSALALLGVAITLTLIAASVVYARRERA